MVAPTPVSAYLHSATMVKAGIYLVARLSPAFASEVGWWRPVVVAVGLTTMVLGGLRALRQHDLKVLLAHGTVSQLGFLVAVFGIGTPEAVAAGSVLLLAHGAFKAANFMVVGIVDHQFGTRDLRRLPLLDRSWWPAVLAAVVGAASMAGIPLLFGFVAKEAVLEAFVDAGAGPWRLAVAVAALGSVLTAAYSARFAWGVLGRGSTAPVDVVPSAVRPAPTFVAPAVARVPDQRDLFVAGERLPLLEVLQQQQSAGTSVPRMPPLRSRIPVLKKFSSTDATIIPRLASSSPR